MNKTARYQFTPSPNFGERKADIDMIIIHYTATPTGQKALDWLRNAESQVSAHYMVMEDGDIHQLVGEDKRAWHAGLSLWQGETDTNSRSIGIEIQHTGDPRAPYRNDQINAVIHLCGDILTRYHIPASHILAHSDVAPDRKQDPGAFFPWDDLARAGIGLYVEPHPIVSGPFLQINDGGQPVEALQAMLSLYGYGLEINGMFDQRTEQVVTAFQRHFRRNRVDGIADRSTIETLNALLRHLPKA